MENNYPCDQTLIVSYVGFLTLAYTNLLGKQLIPTQIVALLLLLYVTTKIKV
jgi:fatty-acid desaturase